MSTGMAVSLIIPVYNESHSIEELIKTIEGQLLQPAEIIIVDGGSTDDTVALAEKLIGHNRRYHIIKVAKALPGEGRNIGAAHATSKWIAFTDAGIKIESSWLKELVAVAEKNQQTDVVYGSYSPVINNWFDQISTFAYVPALLPGKIRGRSIASILLKKEVWEKAGGFPAFRAAEDLLFMESIDRLKFNIAYAPAAVLYWQLRPTWLSAFRKFKLYSKHNVWAKREWDWHYGILKQYAVMLPFLLLTFLHSYWWVFAIAAWILARTVKRCWSHRFQFGIAKVLNPVYILGTAFLILTIDMATFTGWVQAKIRKPDL